MSKNLPKPRSGEDGLFTRGAALAAGWSDRDLRSNANIYRVVHGVYAPTTVPLTHELKCSAVAMRSPPDAIMTGRSAATLYGCALAGPQDEVEIVVSGHKYVNRRVGTRCWSVRSLPTEHQEWNGVRLATMERTVWDLLARNPLKAGVANVDALLHQGFIDLKSVELVLVGRHDHGIAQARRAFQLLDGRAESRPESALRVALVLDGLRPEPQVEIWDARGFVARVDLAFRREMVALEYEGAWHSAPAQFGKDQKRLARIRDQGWHVIVVTAERVRFGYADVINEVRRALAMRA